MEKMIFTNSQGQSIEFGNSKPYILQFLSGVGGIESELYMEKSPFQDGSTYLDTGLNPRVIYLEAAIIGEDETDLYKQRHRLLNVLNPKLGKGKLTYIYSGGEKAIECTVDAPPVFPKGIENKGLAFQRTMFSIICPSPFWEDVFEESQEMAAWIGGLKFPLTLPTTFAEEGSVKTITNNGDIETPVRIEFYGPATNPKIENITTGEYMKLNKELLSGEILLINTGFGNKQVSLVSGGYTANAMHYLDINSTFWQLIAGDNQIKYSADAGAEQVKLNIYWYSRYLGV